MPVELIDISNNQGPIDWVAVAGSGVRGAFIKATEGVFFRDAYFPQHWAHAMHRELWRGAYDFARPGRGPSGADEAGYFCDYVLQFPQIAGDMYVLDLEQDPRTQPPPGTDLGAYVLDWCQTVEGATGVAPLLYSTNYMLASWKCNIPALARFPLWLAAPDAAQWPTQPSAWGGGPAPFWQYSWRGQVAGVRGPCDRDRYHGTEEDLAAYGVQ